MSIKLILIIGSVIAFIVINSRFLREDPEYRKQSAEQKMFSDPLGIRRFKQQPKKMAILTAVLIGPLTAYFIYQILTSG